MIMLGIDAHKRTHTVVAVDELGRRLAAKTTTATTTKDHLELIQWRRPVRHRAHLGSRGLSAPVSPFGAGHARRRGTSGQSAAEDDGALP